MLRESGTQRSDNNERGQHTASRDQPEWTTAEAFSAQGTTESEEGVPYLESEVDDSLCDGAGDAYTLEDGCEVVADDAVS